MVWLKLFPACTDDVTGTIRVGSVKVLVEASPGPVSDTSLAVWLTEAVPFSWISLDRLRIRRGIHQLEEDLVLGGVLRD